LLPAAFIIVLCVIAAQGEKTKRKAAAKPAKALAWVVSADMGLGHQRATYPLRGITHDGSIINMQDPDYTSKKERRVWKRTRSIYESVSRAGKIPLFGKFMLKVMDKIQAIPSFYPKRDLSGPTRAVRYVDRLVLRNDMGKKTC